MYGYFKRVIGVPTVNCIYFWRSKELFDENITAPTKSDYILKPQLSYFDTKTRVEFNGSCLKLDKDTYNHGKVVKIYIVYEVTKNFNINILSNTIKLFI